jgi:glucose/mannose-6-phosphate isomerase
MRDIILNQAEQITHSLDVNKNVRVKGKFDSIILAGMGGSGHPGDLLNALHLTPVPLFVHRSYDLPAIPGKKPLVIISTYSGNTEESLSAYRTAQAQGFSLLANTAGGALLESAKRDKVPLALIDYTGMQPRHTLFASFTGLTAALINSSLAQDIREDLGRVAKILHEAIPQLEAPAKELANNLKGKTPVFTSSSALSFAAKNFKIQTNENAKTPAFWNEFPELNHNEMVGFTPHHFSTTSESGAGFTQPQAKFHVLMLRDKDDHPRIRARMDVTKELYQQWGVEVSDFEVRGDTLLEKLFYAVSFGLWTTYYLALAYGVDPTPVEGVENFKKRLTEVAGSL